MNKFDLYSLKFATSVAQEAIERLFKNAERLKEDPLKEERLLRKKCLYCYYVVGDGIVLSGFNRKNCGICNNEMVFYSSNVSKYCIICSDAYNICIKCGADLDLKERRSLIKKKKGNKKQIVCTVDLEAAKQEKKD